MESAESGTQAKLKPPYGNVVWYEKFFELIRSKSYDKIDTAIIEANIIGGPNATIVFKGLRFLDLVEEDGKTTKKLESLRLTGDEFKLNLKKVVEEAYSDFLKTVAVEQSKPEYVVNYFMKSYGCGEVTAQQTMKIFVYLAQQSGIPISQEFISGKLEKVPRPSRKLSPKEPKPGATAQPAKDIHEIKWGDITIWLPKGDKKAVITAKDLIELYGKSLEGEENQ